MLCYSGVDTSSPIDVHAFQYNGSAIGSIEAPSVTTTVADAMVVFIGYGFSDYAFAGIVSPPSGYTERVEHEMAWRNVYAADKVYSSAGATGVQNAAFSVNWRVNWGAQVALTPDAGGPTEYPQSVSGSLTSSGAITKRTNKATAGALTSAGSVVKRTNKPVAGSLTSAGALTRRAGKAVAGALTSAGALTRRVGKAVAGSLTSSGVLTSTRVVLQAIAGTLTSAGALAKRTSKSVAGTLTSSGAAVKRTSKSVAGALTSSGALAAIRTVLQAISGTLTMSGAVARRTATRVAGAFAPVGVLYKQVATSVAGVLTMGGTLGTIKTFLALLQGSLVSTGVVTLRVNKSLLATLNSTGDLLKRTSRQLEGTLDSSGGVTATRVVRVVLAGVLDTMGSVTKLTTRTLGGVLAFIGSLFPTSSAAPENYPTPSSGGHSVRARRSFRNTGSRGSSNNTRSRGSR
jgi:hypothetical protein